MPYGYPVLDFLIKLTRQSVITTIKIFSHRAYFCYLLNLILMKKKVDFVFGASRVPATEIAHDSIRGYYGSFVNFPSSLGVLLCELRPDIDTLLCSIGLECVQKKMDKMAFFWSDAILCEP